MERVTPNNIQELKENQIFVFGSNKEGLHYGGAAKLAFEKFGAKWGKGYGESGNSYAIDSMSGLIELKNNVADFLFYAAIQKDLVFLVTEIGCGIANFTPEQIAPLFKKAIHFNNIHLPASFWEVLNK